MAKQATEEAAALLVYMPIVVRGENVSDWERKFCASIIAKNRHGNFAPSEKQTAAMRRIVHRFKREVMDEPLIEAVNEIER